jgi:hypothetical protein
MFPVYIEEQIHLKKVNTGRHLLERFNVQVIIV